MKELFESFMLHTISPTHNCMVRFNRSSSVFDNTRITTSWEQLDATRISHLLTR